MPVRCFPVSSSSYAITIRCEFVLKCRATRRKTPFSCEKLQRGHTRAHTHIHIYTGTGKKATISEEKENDFVDRASRTKFSLRSILPRDCLAISWQACHPLVTHPHRVINSCERSWLSLAHPFPTLLLFLSSTSRAVA